MTAATAGLGGGILAAARSLSVALNSSHPLVPLVVVVDAQPALRPVLGVLAEDGPRCPVVVLGAVGAAHLARWTLAGVVARDRERLEVTAQVRERRNLDTAAVDALPPQGRRAGRQYVADEAAELVATAIARRRRTIRTRD